ncbi:MAG: hypothetical protein HY738_13670, partial [Bacteroidia bacterium]|nr:hypothetical protein [Bacteroidia bacterium]
MKAIISILFLILAFSAFPQKIDTIVNYYSDGKVASKGIMFDGAEWGKWLYWDKDGRLIQETDFRHGTLHGKHIYYYNNG